MTYRYAHINERISASQQGAKSKLSIERNGYCIPYGGLPGMFEDLLGGFVVYGDRIVRVPPRRHPVFTWCRATSIESSMFGDLASGVPTSIGSGAASLDYPATIRSGDADKAVVKIIYELPDLDEQKITNSATGGGGGDDPNKEMDIASESWNFAGKVISLPTDYYSYKYSGKPIRPEDFEVKRVFPTIEVQLVRHYCLRIPVYTIAALYGTVNDDDFRLVNHWFPPETVRFEGVQAQRKLTTAKGFQFYEITYKFMINMNWGYAILTSDTTPVDAVSALPDFTGWNRVPNVQKALEWDYTILWERLNPQIHDLDEDVIPHFTNRAGYVVRGFNHLFWQGSL